MHNFQKGKHVTIMDNCIIGDNVVLGDNVYIDHNCIIRDNVTIGSNTTIGANCIIGEYLFDEAETDEFIAVLDGIAPKEYKKLFDLSIFD